VNKFLGLALAESDLELAPLDALRVRFLSKL